jgi:hypothetical protein
MRGIGPSHSATSARTTTSTEVPITIREIRSHGSMPERVHKRTYTEGKNPSGPRVPHGPQVRESTSGTTLAVELLVLEPKCIVWLVLATFPDGQQHPLIAYAEEKDARLHAERATRQPMSDDGRDVLPSAAEIVGVKTLTVSPLCVF